jgi:hypothetical protein
MWKEEYESICTYDSKFNGKNFIEITWRKFKVIKKNWQKIWFYMKYIGTFTKLNDFYLYNSDMLYMWIQYKNDYCVHTNFCYFHAFQYLMCVLVLYIKTLI